MARIRSIKPEFFLHEGMSDLSPLHRLFYIGLWTIADKRGRLEDRPRRIKAALFPWDDCDVGALLRDLTAAGFLVRYEGHNSKGEPKAVIWIPSFEKNQKTHPRETEFDLPNPGPDVFGREISRQAAPFPGRPETGDAKPEKGDAEQRGCLFVGVVVGDGDPVPSPTQQPSSASRTEKPGELADKLKAEFLRQRNATYRWSMADENALEGLASETAEEIAKRWGVALRRKRFPTCDSVKALVQHWNAYAIEEPTGPPGRDARRGVARAEDADHSKNKVLADGTIDF